jgi:hypothetical protein
MFRLFDCYFRYFSFFNHKDSQRFFTKDTKDSLPRIARIFLSLLSIRLLSICLHSTLRLSTFDSFFLNRKGRKVLRKIRKAKS